MELRRLQVMMKKGAHEVFRFLEVCVRLCVCGGGGGGGG